MPLQLLQVIPYTDSGDLYVWGSNIGGRLGTSDQIIEKPTRIAENVKLFSLGEGALAVLQNEQVKVTGLYKYPSLTEIELKRPPKSLCCGEDHIYALSHGNIVYQLGGILGKPNKILRTAEIEDKFRRVKGIAFPGKVLKLEGKYSYMIAIIT
jgi:alpha-tubulin suppressor-like RCC1 family protein